MTQQEEQFKLAVLLSLNGKNADGSENQENLLGRIRPSGLNYLVKTESKPISLELGVSNSITGILGKEEEEEGSNCISETVTSQTTHQSVTPDPKFVAEEMRAQSKLLFQVRPFIEPMPPNAAQSLKVNQSHFESKNGC